jgi:hypothetical protein
MPIELVHILKWKLAQYYMSLATSPLNSTYFFFLKKTLQNSQTQKSTIFLHICDQNPVIGEEQSKKIKRIVHIYSNQFFMRFYFFDY